MPNIADLEIIHVIWDGPLNLDQARTASTDSDFGIYQIYGNYDISGSDALLYIDQAGRGIFAARIAHHYGDWCRWNPGTVTFYLGRIAGFTSVTNENWGEMINKAEAVLVWKIGTPANSHDIRKRPYEEKPILIVNHRRRHRLPEYVSTLTELINTDQADFKVFGSAGHSVGPPVPPSDIAVEEQ
jgi:hypothetical protein